MNARPLGNLPTPHASWMPRQGKPIRTLPDLLVTLAAIAILAAALLLFL